MTRCIPRERDPETGLPVGPRLDHPGPARRPQPVSLAGRYARLEPLDPVRHRQALFAASTPADAEARFRYLPVPPPDSPAAFDSWLAESAGSADPMYFAVIDRASGRAEGRQSLMRIQPARQCIEIGNIYWGPGIAGTRVATEAFTLLAGHCLDTLGYRRLEWKCDALNAPSRRAARRFGFTWEGHFRRATIVRGRSRDTAWYSIIDDEWPALRAAWAAWLAPENFHRDGRQRTRLSALTAAARRREPADPG